jgi:hypothetical protein
VIFALGAPDIDMDPIYSIGLRIIFDRRRYF